MFDTIDRFSGEYRFLSNFYECEIRYGDRTYKTAEHAYQSAKSTDFNYKNGIQNCFTAGQAKRFGRTAKLRPDWELIKCEVMLTILRIKFSDSKLRKLLLDTGDINLVEGNTWGDKFWGVDINTNTGKNVLGILLMKVRDEIKTNAHRK